MAEDYFAAERFAAYLEWIQTADEEVHSYREAAWRRYSEIARKDDHGNRNSG